MNHAEWKTRRHRALLGEAVEGNPEGNTEGNPEYDRLYEEAELAHDLGQMVYDRRTALGRSDGRSARSWCTPGTGVPSGGNNGRCE